MSAALRATRRDDGAAKRVERALASAVLRGEYPAGSRLPTMRELAERFAVNLGTVQRAAASLERTGLVSARQGSGIRVNDLHASADLSLVPVWIGALADQPERAAALLGEFLEARRVLATHLLVKHRRTLAGHRAALDATVARLADAARAGTAAFRAADLALARELVDLTGHTVIARVLNAAGELLDAVPALAEAMYAEPRCNVRATRAVLAALGSRRADARVRAEIEEAFAALDAATVARFAARLASR